MSIINNIVFAIGLIVMLPFYGAYKVICYLYNKCVTKRGANSVTHSESYVDNTVYDIIVNTITTLHDEHMCPMNLSLHVGPDLKHMTDSQKKQLAVFAINQYKTSVQSRSQKALLTSFLALLGEPVPSNL